MDRISGFSGLRTWNPLVLNILANPVIMLIPILNPLILRILIPPFSSLKSRSDYLSQHLNVRADSVFDFGEVDVLVGGMGTGRVAGAHLEGGAPEQRLVGGGGGAVGAQAQVRRRPCTTGWSGWMLEGVSRTERGFTSDCRCCCRTASTSSLLYLSVVRTSMVKVQVSGTTLCWLPALMMVTVIFTGPASAILPGTGTGNPVNVPQGFVNGIVAFFAGGVAGLAPGRCNLPPSTLFRQWPGASWVGSPTMAKLMGGRCGSTSSSPPVPETSSSP
jgi:hypothetical protein